MRILILEDDYSLAEALQDLLRLENIEVDIAQNAQEAYDLTFEKSYDLYLFDINLIDDNGIEILKQLKEADDQTPVIFISALTDLETIEEAFDAGAIDYIKKPFEIEEVLIRIKSRIRRKITLGSLQYDPATKELTKGGQKVSLSPTLLTLFHELIVNKGKIVPKTKLLEGLEHPSENALRVNISKLKKKLGIDIKSIKNEGYMLE